MTPIPTTIKDNSPATFVKEEYQEPAPPASTPRKRNRKQQPTTTATDDENEHEPETPSKKPKSPSKKTGAMGPIPATYEDASPIDKMLIRMKEVEGKNWSEIRAAVEEAVGGGVKIGGSTLQVRYARMKANFVVFEKDDEARLLQTKKEIEGKFELEKWQRIAEGIEDKGGAKYPSPAVQKKFKELSKKGNGNGLAVEE